MTVLLALAAVITAQFFIQLGNLWFTYGLWPQNWASFSTFVVLALVNALLLDRVRKEMGER